jgi:ribosomal protein L40E
MAVEALAAGLVGLLALFAVLRPLIWPPTAVGPVYEPVEQEETARGVALLALKEIEFDRETGKLSEADYEFLKAKYTSAALEALRLDSPVGAGAVSDDVEAMVAAKVRALRSASARPPSDTSANLLPTSQLPRLPLPPVCRTCGPRPEPDAVFCSTCGRRLPSWAVCDRCGAALQPDSRFCKACGRQVAA